MRKRTGDWRDIFSAFVLARSGAKLYLGLVAVFSALVLMILVAVAQGTFFGGSSMLGLGDPRSQSFVVRAILQGNGLQTLHPFLQLLNPFKAGIVHFAFSVVFYLVLLLLWTRSAGMITRLTALEYARDELPARRDVLPMVRSKRSAYFFAPASPLIGIIITAGIVNGISGLVASIPYVGPWLLAVPGSLVTIASTSILLFIAVLGVLSFGLMLPAISIGGKDAFEGFSSACSYVLWGFNRFVCYTVLGAIVGVVSTLAVWALSELFIALFINTIRFGFIGAFQWGGYVPFGTGNIEAALAVSTRSLWFGALPAALVCVPLFCIRLLPVAYLFSYFFTANTIICLLLRKDVDRIEIEEIYEEEAAEEQGEEVETGVETEAPEAETREEAQEEPEEEPVVEEEEPGPEDRTEEEPQAGEQPQGEEGSRSEGEGIGEDAAAEAEESEDEVEKE